MLNYFGFTIAQVRNLEFRSTSLGGQGTIIMLNYFGFTIAQVRILDFRSTRQGGGQDTQATVSWPHPVFLTDCAISYQDHLKKANT